MTGDFSLAVHALVYLNHKNTHLTSEQLAQNICTNPARVRRVMARLKGAGLVTTREGSSGGYTFAGKADVTPLSAVADALGTRFAQASWHSGSVDADCRVASGMAGVMDELYDTLNADCRARLEKITLADMEKKLF